MRLRERLHKLDARIPALVEADYDAAEFARACQIVDELSATMAERHQLMFHQFVFENKENALTAEIQRRFNQAMNGSKRPLALPGVVGDAYLTVLEPGEAITTIADCELCAYELPIVTRNLSGDEYLRGDRVKGRRLFDACPLCGGAVGYNAFFLRHGYQPDGPA